jgi:hypothetical protein
MSGCSQKIIIPLYRIAMRQRSLDLFVATLRLLIVLLLLGLAGAIARGMLDDDSSSLRVTLATAVWVIALALLTLTVARLPRRQSPVALARQIERRRPDLNERLSSALELSVDESFGGSTALVAHLTHQAESDAAFLSPAEFVPLKPVLPWIAWLMATLATWAILIALPQTHHLLAAGLRRLVIPWSETSPQALEPQAPSPPRLTDLAVRYDYPVYTGLAPRTVTGLDGTVEAVVGTRATIEFQTSRRLNLEKSRLLVKNAPAARLEISDHEANTYSARFLVRKDASYALDLTDPVNGVSRREPPRAIHAHADQVPSIVIESPAADVNARPDDTVPLRFLAADDFGVAHIELLVSVDSREPRTLEIPFDPADRRHVTGPVYNLAIDTLLAADQFSEPHEISYEFRVVDNRDPGPQLSMSARQSRLVRPDQPRSFQGEQEQRTATALQNMLVAALKEIDRAAARISRGRTRDPGEPLGEWQHKELHQAATDLSGMSKGLSRAADQAMDSAFAGVATAIKQTAEGPLREAAEEASRADIESEDGHQRNGAIAKSTGALTSAHRVLQRLLDGQQIEQVRGLSEAARDLESAARSQRAGRNQLARTRLRQAFEEFPSLRDENPSGAALREAAQAAQSAEQFQMNGASEQAAGQLQLAASALGRAISDSVQPGSPMRERAASAPTPIAPRGSGLSGPVPAAVRDLGLSAEDWARLPELAQRDLLNTAQQNPPLQYREMVRDYFVKLARMHKDADESP